MRKKTIRAWAIINRAGELTNKRTEHYQHYVFKERQAGDYLAWNWNRDEYKYIIVPCTITYSLPEPKPGRKKK